MVESPSNSLQALKWCRSEIFWYVMCPVGSHGWEPEQQPASVKRCLRSSVRSVLTGTVCHYQSSWVLLQATCVINIRMELLNRNCGLCLIWLRMHFSFALFLSGMHDISLCIFCEIDKLLRVLFWNEVFSWTFLVRMSLYSNCCK